MQRGISLSFFLLFSELERARFKEREVFLAGESPKTEKLARLSIAPSFVIVSLLPS